MTQRTIIQEQRRHHGARYYTLKPEGYTPNWENQTWLEMVEWCMSQYGVAGDVWEEQGVCHRWYVNNAMFWFREQEDAAMFILRWS